MEYGLTKIALTAFAFFAVATLTLLAANATPLVLNCKIEEGMPKGYSKQTQIMIDEEPIPARPGSAPKEKGMVILDFEHVGSDPIRQTGKDIYIDLSMKIIDNYDKWLMAQSGGHVFLMTKHDARFAHSWVIPAPLNDGTFTAFGNTHMGSCIKSPFH